ncbi:hypothetical protein PR002_g17529 [Phytophthora rubi]|uniref:Chromo domain-containing protein n=1 Tax=Phytophthora rubi TaxID=129364 RepID=A0A6A3KB61_9STRA|nr:hypothetical protein PR002_g17529 [Phytophthora rubi]
MRALVKGVVNDARTRVLLDTGANVSVISEKFAKQLRLRGVQGHGRCMEIQGFTKGTMTTSRRALVKVALGWQHVYEFELWIMDHGAGVDVVLGTDFMIPAGVRLDMFYATARLPDEVSIPLIKTLNIQDDRREGPHVNGGPTENLLVPSRGFAEYRTPRSQPSSDTHEVWVRRTKALLPTVVKSQRGKLVRVRLTNISNRPTSCPAHFPVLMWVPIGDLPKSDGYVRIGSSRYRDWQMLVYEGGRDKVVLRREAELYSQWLASQPPAVDRPEYTTPTQVLRRPTEDFSVQQKYANSTAHHEQGCDKRDQPDQVAIGESSFDDDPVADTAPPIVMLPSQTDFEPGVSDESTLNRSGVELPSERPGPTSAPNDPSEDDPGPSDESAGDSGAGRCQAESSVAILDRTYSSVATVLSADADDDPVEEYSIAGYAANMINLEDYPHEQALLPDLDEVSVMELDYSAANVRHPKLSPVPEDGWKPSRLAGGDEVEAILDDCVPLLNSTERAVREFQVKWVGHGEPTWEPAAELSCGELEYDYLREKHREQRLQMAQVADED